jgi:predicted TIM-barrel fold metal-dependent hydrolase
LCAAFPKLSFIIAHPGEYDNYMRNLERVEKYPNAYLDICGTGLFRNRMLWYGVNRVGAERFLFGTDYPVCDPAMQVAAVKYQRITDHDRELIFSGNFLRLLGM